MITKDGERTPSTQKQYSGAKPKAKQNTGTGKTSEKKIPNLKSSPSSSPTQSGTLTPAPQSTPSEKTTSSSSSSSRPKKKALSQAEKSAALNDLMDRATIGSSRTYGLSFQSSANRKISDAESKRKQTLVEQATKNGYLVGQNTKQAQDFRNTVNQKLERAISSGKSPSEARADEQQRIRTQRTVNRDQEKGYNRTVSELNKQIAAIDSELAPLKNKIEGRYPVVSEKSGKTKEALTEERSKLIQKKKNVTGDYGVLDSIYNSLEAGAGQFNSGVTSTLNAGKNVLMQLEALANGGWDKETGKFVKGDAPFFGSLFQPVSDLNQSTKDTTAQFAQKAATGWNQYGKGGNLANQLIQGTVSAVPNAVLAMATAGGSTAATLAPEASGLTATVADAVQKLSKDPMYWTSFIQSFGNSYDEAIEKGATEDEALLATLLSSTANAIVEVGGGVEQLPGELRKEGLTSKDKIRKWVSSSLDEGKEEVVQGMIERLVNKAVYNQDAPWNDDTGKNEDAVFNLDQSLKEFGMGTAIGGILGGGQMLAQGIAARGQRIVDPTASPWDQAMLDTYRGVQTPENVTQVREPTELDNIVMAAMNQNKNTSADVAEVQQKAELPKVSMEDFANNDSPIWRNVEYGDTDTKTSIMQQVHKDMVERGEVVQIPAETVDEVSQYFPDMRNVSKKERVPVLRQKMNELKGLVRGYLNTLKGVNYEFEVDGNILDAKLYDTGIKEVMEKVTKDKGGMLLNSDQIFKNAQYLYSSPDYDGNSNVQRWNYFYTPIQAGDETLGVRIAVRDMKQTGVNPTNSQIYNWNIKKDATLGGGRSGETPLSSGTSSAASSNQNVAQSVDSVNRENVADLGAMQSRFESEPKQSQTQSNTIGAMEEGWNVPEEQRSPIMYDTISEEKSLDNARLRLAQDYEGEKAELRQKYNWSGEEVDMGMTILDNYRRAAEETGDWTQYSEWRKTVSEHGTAAGQALQAYAKYSRQTGGGIVADAQAFLEENKLKKKADTNAIMDKVSSLAEKYDAAVGTGNKDADVNVDDLVNIIKDVSKTRKIGLFGGDGTKGVGWAIDRISNYARTEAEGDGGKYLDFMKTFTANSIYSIAVDSGKTSVGQKVLTLSRMAKLAKDATIARNLVSNNLFDPVDSISRDISVPLDMLLSKYTGTRSVALDASWISKAKRKGSLDGLAMAWMEVGLDIDAAQRGGKYVNTTNRTFKMSDGVASRLLSTWEMVQGYALNATDEFQKGGIEAEVQRGIDKLYEKGKIKDDSLRNAGEQEALYRTFQDHNVLSDAALGLRNVADRVEVGGIPVGSFNVPFAQVPMNLKARGIEYSPSGFLIAAHDLLDVFKAAKSGTLTAEQQAKAVQGVGRALNGTLITALSTTLSALGIIKVTGLGDDDNEEATDKARGLNGTQINLAAWERVLGGTSREWQDGDMLLSIGFLEPLNAQLITGALIAQDILDAQKNGEKVNAGTIIGDSFQGTLQSVLEMPVFSVFTEVAENYNRSNAATPGGRMADAASKYLAGQVGGMVPNNIRGIAQGLDDTERDVYTSDNYWEQARDSIKASIPVLRETLPAKKDVWGNDVKNEGGMLNYLNRTVNPGNLTRYKDDAVSSELDKISEDSGESLYPQRYAPRSIKVGDEDVKLTDAQRDTYQETYGSEYYKAAQSLMQSEGYKDLPATVKAEALRQARKIAEDAAKEAAGVGFEMSDDNRTVADKSAEERVNDLMVRAIQNEKYVSPDAKEKLDRIGRFIDTKPWAENVPENVSTAAKKEAKAYYAALEAAKYGEPLDEKYEKLADMNQSELAKYFVSQAVGSEKYMTDENKAKMDEVQNLYGTASYVGISPDLIESAKEKTAEYYQEVEKAKYGFELSKDKRKLEGADAKTVADFFLDKAVEAKFEDKNGDGTNKDEILEAYNKNEIDDRTAIAVLSDQQADAYRDYGIAAGVTPRQMLDAASEYARLETYKDMDDQVINSKEAQFDAYLEAQGYPEDQVKAIRMAFYGDKATSYRKAVEKLNAGTITDKEAKKLLTPNYQSGWSHNVAKTGVSMSDYIDALATFEDAPTADERDKMGFDSKWEWFCNELNKNTELTKEQKYAIAISADSTYTEKTKKKIANKLGATYVAPATASGESGAVGGSGGGTWSGTKEDKEPTQAEKAYERFGMAAGATEAMYQEAKAALKNIETVYDMDGNVVRSAEDQFDSWLERRDWTEDQKDAVRAGFYADTVKNLRYLSSELREGNISVAAAKSELSARAQTGWTHSVMDTGAAMADYIDAWAQFKQAPNEDERKAQGFGTKWAWFCDYLNQTDMTAEQKYAIAVSVQDYAESTRKKIQKNVGWDGVSSAEQEPQEETYDIRTDDGYREYLSLLLKRKDRYEAKDGSVWSVGENGDVIVRTKDGRQLRARAVLGRNGFDDEPGEGYTVGSKAGQLAYKMMQNGVMKTWDAPDGWTWKLVRGEIIAEKNGTKIPVRMAG